MLDYRPEPYVSEAAQHSQQLQLDYRWEPLRFSGHFLKIRPCQSRVGATVGAFCGTYQA